MLRNITSIIAGYVIWTAIFLGGATAVRAINPGAHDEAGMTRDRLTLVIYLAISVVASVVAGYCVARIAEKSKMRCVFLLVVALLATGVPVQLSAWDKLPAWYNVIFLTLLIPLPLAGGMMAMSTEARRRSA
jgi:hypothetical protein